MGDFRFGIMGAAQIANRFCDAVKNVEGCTVVAVASRSMERAKEFAAVHGIAHTYDSYEQMLCFEELDAVYIATIMSTHYELVMLCLQHQIPVLCEKAMFMTKAEAEKAFAMAKQQQVFTMEAMWSRFLPANVTAKQWIDEGRIGKITMSESALGFCAPTHENNRFFYQKMGGGVSYDLMVYNYDMTRWMIGQDITRTQMQVVKNEDHVDVSEVISLQFGDALAVLTGTFLSRMDERMVIYGEQGRIVIPKFHMAMEAYLYGNDDVLIEHFVDTKTKNGFTYEIEEAMDCVRKKLLESPHVPHQMTIDSAALYDQIHSEQSIGI